MTAKIQVGPEDNMRLPYESLGNIFYKELKEKDPDRIILINSTTNEKISYGKVLKLSIKLSATLIKLGIKKGNVITIIAQNDWKYMITIMAGFFVGATVNLLNHDYKFGELEYLLKICQPVLVFSTSKNMKNILKLRNDCLFCIKDIVSYDEGSSNNVTNFDDLLANVNDTSHINFEPIKLDPQKEVALILTSSGTTGLPKCVIITHANFRITLMNAGDPDLMDITEKEIIIGYLPFCHILGTLICLASILFGSKFIIMNKFNPENFLQIIQEHKITKMFAVRPILLFLIKSPLVDKYDLSSLQDIVCGSGIITKELEEMVQKRLKIESVRQAFGTTEVTGAATVVPKNFRKYGSIGKVAIAFQMKVCNPELGEILPPNQVGELRISSPGVMKGYLGNHEETIASFDEEGFIKTGDLGYYDEEGYFFITGRLKDIIKCKGYQISPEELENLLVGHPSVTDVAVMGIPDESAGELPLAFVVKKATDKITEEELIHYVKENISVQKKLHGIKFVNEIPRNVSGKISRRKLEDLFIRTQLVC